MAAHLSLVPRFRCTRSRPRRTVQHVRTFVRPSVGRTVKAACCSGDRGAREGGDHGDGRVRGVLTAGDGGPPFYFPPPLHGTPNTRSRTRTSHAHARAFARSPRGHHLRGTQLRPYERMFHWTISRHRINWRKFILEGKSSGEGETMTTGT